MTLSEIFAAFICGSGNITENDLYLSKRSIVDTVGATIAGSRTDVVRQTLPVYAAPGKSTIIGVGKGYSAQGAAFINGVSGHELELDDTLTSRDNINGKMTEILDEATDQWGIKVGRVELKNIIPPAEIQNAMEKQMKAERDRRETLLQAEGHKAAVIMRAEGDKQAMILAAEGERDARIARAEGEAKAIYLAKKAEADGLIALKEAGADAAVLELKRYEALVKLSNGKASKIIVPTDVVNAAKSNVMFSEITGIGDTTPEGTTPAAPKKTDPCCD